MVRTCCAEILLMSLAASSHIFETRPAVRGVRLAGLTDVTESFKELSDLLQGIHSFISGVSFISETIGFGTVLLFLAVLIFSAGYSALGMPKGKASFFSSLITADALWVLWKVSFNARLADYIFPMIKSNLIVLCPLAAVTLLARVAPSLFSAIKAGASSLFHKKRHIGAREAMVLCDECQARSSRLSRAVVEDILASGGSGGSVSLSDETRKSIAALKVTLEKLDTAAD